MSIIGDILGVAKDIESRAKDRRDIDALRQIHSLALSLQKQHAEVVDRADRVQRENVVAAAKIRDLERQLAESKGDDVCPFCKSASGALKEIKPSIEFGDLGIKQGYYKCSNQSCGKTYDREMPA